MEYFHLRPPKNWFAPQSPPARKKNGAWRRHCIKELKFETRATSQVFECCQVLPCINKVIVKPVGKFRRNTYIVMKSPVQSSIFSLIFVTSKTFGTLKHQYRSVVLACISIVKINFDVCFNVLAIVLWQCIGFRKYRFSCQPYHNNYQLSKISSSAFGIGKQLICSRPTNHDSLLDLVQ